MTDGQIWAVMLRLKVFTQASVIEKLGVKSFLKQYVKEKVRSLITAQVKNGILVVIDESVPVFATQDATKEDIENFKRTCPICKSTFFPRQPIQEFCSPSCRKKHYQLYHEVRRRKDGMRVGYRRRWTAEDIAKLKKYKQQGYTYQEIAERLGRTKTAVIEKYKQIKGVRK